MRTAESKSNLVRSEECVVETKTDIEQVLIRKSSSEDTQLDKKSSSSRTNPLKLKKIKSLRSRLSLRFRSLRDSQSLVRRRSLDPSIDFRQDDKNLHLKLADDFTSDSGPESPRSDLENSAPEPKKKKRKLLKRFSLNSFKWKKVKPADDLVVTTATQTSPVERDRVLAQRTSSIERSSSRAPFNRVQKILITISGRKTEPKEKRPSREILNGLNSGGAGQDFNGTTTTATEPKLNITHSERDTPPSERAPTRPIRRKSAGFLNTVASSDDVSSRGTSAISQDTGAVRKPVRAVRLERQVSRDEASGEDDEKFLFLRRELSQERGVRFPRPASSSYTDSTKLSKGAREEKLNRILDYVKKTCSENNLNEPNLNDNEAPINTPDRIKRGTSPSLRQIRDDRRNSSFFHSANSNDSGSPVSDAGRRRIKYVGQPTFYTDEEKEILEGKRQTFINLSGISEYSFESEYSSESIMPAYGDLVMDPEEAPIMTSGTEKREHLYKILVIGELGAGKTSFIKRYVHQFFSANYRATIGVDFALKVLHWDQNTIVRLQLWDIAGQERFGNMTRVYYKEAVGAFIVFDVTRSGTFDAVSKWKEDLDSKVQLPGGGSIPCILLANKCDQEKQGIVTNPEKMDEYVKENGFSGWFETSAKENINIEEAARALVSQILLNDKLITQADIIDNDRFALGNTGGSQAPNTDKRSCLC